MRGNVLLTETTRGLARFGRPQLAYFYCLAIQAGAVLLWWPKVSGQVGQNPPLTLFALLLTLAATLSYQSIRMGAEEILLAGQQSIHEWLVATAVPIGTLIRGYVIAHIIQTLHWVLLSLPLVVIAWSIDGGHWNSVMLALGVILLLATAFRIAGVCVYLAIGQYGQVTWYSLRVLLVLGFVAVAGLYPAANVWKLTEELLSMSYTGRPPVALLAFCLFYGFWIILFGVVSGVLARRIRNHSNLNVV